MKQFVVQVIDRNGGEPMALGPFPDRTEADIAEGKFRDQLYSLVVEPDEDWYDNVETLVVEIVSAKQAAGRIWEDYQ